MSTTLKIHGHEVEIEELRRVVLKPGEVVMVRVASNWTRHMMIELRDSLEEYVFPHNRVAVIPAESIEVMSPTEDTEV